MHILIATFLFVVLLFPASAWATSEVPGFRSPGETLDQLIQRNDVLIKAKVIDQGAYAQIGTGPQPFVVTELTLKIQTVLYGQVSSSRITIDLPGGCDFELDLCLESDFFPKLKTGETALFFLNQDANGSYKLTDFKFGLLKPSQGVYQPLGLTEQSIQKQVSK